MKSLVASARRVLPCTRHPRAVSPQRGGEPPAPVPTVPLEEVERGEGPGSVGDVGEDEKVPMLAALEDAGQGGAQKGLGDASAAALTDATSLQESKVPGTPESAPPAEAAVPLVGKGPEAAPAPGFWEAYRNKFRGAGAKGPPVPTWSYSAVSWVGSFTGIGTLGLIHTYFLPHFTLLPLVMLVGSFGAMAVLLFGQPAAPPSQPWNAICGNGIGGLVGVVVYEGAEWLGLGKQLWLTGGLAVSLTIIGQERMQSQHPPGGATALLFTLMPNLQVLHWVYVICPALLGAVIFVFLSMLINNLSEGRSYPVSTHPLNLEPAPEAKPDTQAPARELAAVTEAQAKQDPAPGFLGGYFGKWRGKKGPPMPQPPWSQTGFSWLGAFLGIATLGLLQMYAMPLLPVTGIVVLVGSFGAMSVLVYSMPGAPFSQPKNALLGNTLGGLVGVAVYKSCRLCGLGDAFWLMCALAVSLTIVAQEQTSSVHPPGGATALIFVIRSVASELDPDHPFYMPEMSDLYFFCPGFLGAAVLVCIGLLVNNLSEKRSYPGRWWS